MNDINPWIAIALGVAAWIIPRLIDFYFPKGWMSNWTLRHAKQLPPHDEGENDD